MKRIIRSGGENNPSVKKLKSEIFELKRNISASIVGYSSQLEKTKQQIELQNLKYNTEFSSLPEKEKKLRSIERSQKIQESLYLFLLQKREEAEVSYAVTEPSIKIVEYALSSDEPVSPKKPVSIIISIFIGLLVPFMFLYFKFLFDTKIQSKEDISDVLPDANIIGELPEVDNDDDKVFDNPNQRTVISEAARILSSNASFLIGLGEKAYGSVLLNTSTIKGEGKTFASLNLSLALASIDKKFC